MGEIPSSGSAPNSSIREAGVAQAPTLAEFSLVRESPGGNIEERVRGVALSEDGKYLCPARPFEGKVAVDLVGDPSHSSCLGWLARDAQWIIVKTRQRNCVPVRIVAASEGGVAAGRACVLLLPTKEDPRHAFASPPVPGPEGEAFDPAAPAFWIALPEGIVEGNVVLDDRGTLAGLVDAIPSGRELGHVSRVKGPLPLLDEASRRAWALDWDRKAPPPEFEFADAALAPGVEAGLAALEGPALLSACDALLREHGDSARAWYLASLGYARAGAADRALASARTLPKVAPKKWEAWFFCGDALNGAGKPALALDAYQMAAENGAPFPRTALRLADMLFKTGNEVAALDQLESLTRQSPEFYEGWLRLGALRERCGEFPAAVRADLQALRLDPQSAFAWEGLARIYERAGQWPDAVQSYRCLAGIEPGNANVWYNLGRALSKTGAEREAFGAFLHVVALDSNDREAWLQIARMEAAAGHPEKAAAACREVVRIDPENVGAWNALAGIGRDLGDAAAVEEAAACLKKIASSGKSAGQTSPTPEARP